MILKIGGRSHFLVTFSCILKCLATAIKGHINLEFD